MIGTTGFLKFKGSISRPNWRFYEIRIKTEIEDSFWNWELNNIDLYKGKGSWVVLIVGSL